MHVIPLAHAETARVVFAAGRAAPLVLFTILFWAGSGAQCALSKEGGGFAGPGIAVSLAKQAESLRDDTPVILRGRITRSLGGEKYLFTDTSGSVILDIDDSIWNGQRITPDDPVEIHGEVDKDWGSVEIDVDRIVKQ